MQGHRERIQSLDHAVQTRWLDSDESKPSPGSGQVAEFSERWQEINFNDIDACETMIVDLTTGLSHMGGTYVELGYAIGRQKDIWLVGQRPNVYCFNPCIQFFANWEQVYRVLGVTEEVVRPLAAKTILYSLESTMDRFRSEPPNTRVQVPSVVPMTKAWACVDSDQIYAKPGMKVLRKLHV